MYEYNERGGGIGDHGFCTEPSSEIPNRHGAKSAKTDTGNKAIEHQILNPPGVAFRCPVVKQRITASLPALASWRFKRFRIGARCENAFSPPDGWRLPRASRTL